MENCKYIDIIAALRASISTRKNPHWNRFILDDKLAAERRASLEIYFPVLALTVQLSRGYFSGVYFRFVREFSMYTQLHIVVANKFSYCHGRYNEPRKWTAARDLAIKTQWAIYSPWPWRERRSRRSGKHNNRLLDGCDASLKLFVQTYRAARTNYFTVGSTGSYKSNIKDWNQNFLNHFRF